MSRNNKYSSVEEPILSDKSDKNILIFPRGEESQSTDIADIYRGIIYSMSKPIFVIDSTDYRFIDLNPAAEKMYGYTRSEFLEIGLSDIIVKSIKNQSDDIYDLDNYSGLVQIQNHRNKNGDIFQVEATIDSFLLNGKRIICCMAKDISERRRIEKSLEVKNIALSEVLNQIEFEKNELIRMANENIGRIIIPLLNELKADMNPEFIVRIDRIKDAILEFQSPELQNIKPRMTRLTPRETQICELIKKGKLSKEIARDFGLSVETIRSQRKSIRKKLRLAGEKVNLRTYLESVKI